MPPLKSSLLWSTCKEMKSYPHFLLEVKTKKIKKTDSGKTTSLDDFPSELNFLSLNKNVSWRLLLLLLAFLPSFALLRTRISSTTLLGPSLEFWDHLSHIKHHILTGGKLLQTEAAVSLLQLNSDTTPELGVPVPLPRMHFVVLCVDIEPSRNEYVLDLITGWVLHALLSGDPASLGQCLLIVDVDRIDANEPFFFGRIFR